MDNIIDVEYLEQKSTVVRHILMLYLFLGGMFYEPYITRKFKYLARCLGLFAYFAVTLPALGLLLEWQSLDFQTMQHCVGTIVFFTMWSIIVLITYSKRSTFHSLFNHINDNDNDTLSEPNLQPNHFKDKIHQTNITNVTRKVRICFTAWISVVYVSKILQKLLKTLSTGEFYVDYQKDFIVPLPFVDSQSFVSYFIVYNLAFVPQILFLIIIGSAICLPAVLSIHLKNQTVSLLNDIKYHSDVASECLEECLRREEQILANSWAEENVTLFQLREIARRRERDTAELMLKVRQWIKIHQKWIRCTNLFKECTANIFTIQISSLFVGSVIAGFLTLKGTLDSQHSGFEYSLFTFMCALHQLILCNAGNTIRETSDSLSIAIYSTPWYYLPVKDQKVLLNFLCLTQKSQEIKIFNIMPLCLKLLPEMLNNVYECVQYMRLFEIWSMRS